MTGTHEIVHSWSGNLVTNTNWENFWLNEGFTVFGERKVTKILSGDQGDIIYNVNSILNNATATEAMAGFGFDDSFSSLTPRLNGRHPDDAFSKIPYEIGF